MIPDPGAALTAAINRLADILERQNAGTCDSVYRVIMFDATYTVTCRHPHGHTGLHANEDDTSDGQHVWATNADGASTITAPTCGAIRTEWSASRVKAFGPASNWPCLNPPEHTTTTHMDRDGDEW